MDPAWFREASDAVGRGDHQAVVALTEPVLQRDPGNDAAHELRARSLLALGRVADAERHAADAVRLDPDEIRYRELLAEVLAAGGAHRDAAVEYARLARNDPRQTGWLLAEAQANLDACQPERAEQAAQRAVRLDPASADAQLALALALIRRGYADGALRAAIVASELLPGDAHAREVLADSRTLAGQHAAAFGDYRSLAAEASGADRERVVAKALGIYRARGGVFARLLAAVPRIFELLFLRGRLSVR